MPQSALDQIADHGRTHGLADDETRTRRGEHPPGCVRVAVVPVQGRTASQMHYQERAAGPASAANRGREVLAPPQPVLGGQHGMT
ncbi:hypothetical protein GCM10012280_21740 [Wenjunlia tyrosinilytica]|uniref:Uncharacterized protein n=1 Tax=Wenjunlia tyrosinilytica TaxID=1544741 RepID=A0A917ZMK8_9ACTN|nr:hypothetical protein GCM10012280_21740 [Wenjunlia tyrosinilytica]